MLSIPYFCNIGCAAKKTLPKTKFLKVETITQTHQVLETNAYADRLVHGNQNSVARQVGVDDVIC